MTVNDSQSVIKELADESVEFWRFIKKSGKKINFCGTGDDC